MKTECPHCGQHYEVDEEYLDQIVNCASCGEEFVVEVIRDAENVPQKRDPGQTGMTSISNAADDNVASAPRSSTGKKNAIVCEMCGSSNLIKQNGVFVCQSCGIKYSLEEARKLMAGGTVDIVKTANVKIAVPQPQMPTPPDPGRAMSEKLKNLYTLARRAKDENNSENAEKYYGLILLEDPESWEANFYQIFYKAMSCKIAEIDSAATSVERCLKNVLDLITREPDEGKRNDAFSEVTDKATDIAAMLANAASNHFENIDSEIKSQYTQDYINNILSSAQICYTLGDLLDSMNQTNLSHFSWKTAINIHVNCIQYLEDKNAHKNVLDKYASMIRRTEPGYVLPNIPSSGCYIASAVYGSYDCPEVWTLRRFRDFQLGMSWYGRLFIRTYYAVSPQLVKHFGHTRPFQVFWRKKLDRLVRKLNDQGVSDAPYVDRRW